MRGEQGGAEGNRVSGGRVATSNLNEADEAVRLRALARRCRDLSELTVVPDVSRELIEIALALEGEAARAERS
jgi:hypothetical protein